MLREPSSSLGICELILTNSSLFSTYHQKPPCTHLIVIILEKSTHTNRITDYFENAYHKHGQSCMSGEHKMQCWMAHPGPCQQNADTFDMITRHWPHKTAKRNRMYSETKRNYRGKSWQLLQYKPGQTCGKVEVPSIWDQKDSMLRVLSVGHQDYF